jgi:uncharacterized membrane protein YkoI
LTRRAFILLVLVWLGFLPPVASAWAKDGESSSGSNSGSGSSNSGSDDGGGDDDGDDGDEDNSGSGKKSEQDRALSAVSAGRAMSLEQAMKRLRVQYAGRVIDVALRNDGKRLVYRFKLKSNDGVVRKVTMDAATGDIRGFLGF